MARHKAKRDRIQAKSLSEKQLRTLIKVLAGPRSDAGTGRFHALHEMIRKRDEHFFNRPAADQKLDEPHEDIEPYQTDALRRTWVQLKARYVENPFRVRVKAPRDTETQRRKASALEAVLQRGIEDLQDRLGLNIQADLADGQIVSCYGVLHWSKQSDVYPHFPDAEVLDELPADDPDEAKRFRKDEKGENAGKFVETSESLLKRDEIRKATSGFPFFIDVPRADTFSFIQDRSAANGMAIGLLLRTVPMVDYSEKLRLQEQLVMGTITTNQHEESRKLRIYEEREMPASFEPSGENSLDWGLQVVIAQLWTRDEFFELVAPAQGGKLDQDPGFRIVKSYPHPYGMPPFALALADHVNHPDPALAHMPYLEGIYRIKPFFDHDMTLGRAIAEQIALPFYYIELADGAFMSGEDGKTVILSRNALAAQALPAGAKIVSISPEMNSSVIEFLNRAGEEMAEAAPESGFVEVGASTQPWTIRLAQDQANSQVKTGKASQAKALRTMVRNFAHVMSLSLEEGGFGQPVPVLKDDEVISIDPKDIEGLTVEIDINPHSSAQVIANIEHGRQWLADPLFPLTTTTFVEEFMQHDGDPDELVAVWEAEQIYNTTLKPQVIAQELASRFSELIVLGPGGRFIGLDGQELSSEEVLAADARKQAAAGAGVPGDVVAESAATLSDLPPLVTTGVEPVAGVPG